MAERIHAIYVFYICCLNIIKNREPIRKVRVIINIRELNKLTISDVYLFLR
jgi:hypothetical protein